MITEYRMALLVLMIWVIAAFCAGFVIALKLEATLPTLPELSEWKPATLAQRLHDSRSQEGSDPSGKRN
jgi:hypothetical protein